MKLESPLVRDYFIFTLKGSHDRRERRLLLPQQPTVVTLLGLLFSREKQLLKK